MVITVTCPSCSSSFPVDPAKIPEGGVNARCTECSDVFRIEKPVEIEPISALEEPTPISTEASPADESMGEAFAPAVESQLPATDEPAPSLVDSPDDWVVESEEVTPMEPEPLPDVSDRVPDIAAPEPAGEAEWAAAPEPAATPEPAAEVASDPFEEAAPFEQAAPEVAEPLPAPPAVEEPAPAPPIEEPEPAETSGVQGFTFGRRDPTDKAKRLARVLVSDMIMYNAERHQSALAAGTLLQDFEEEIAKSWKEFVEQVGEDLAHGVGRQFWTEALNDILAKGEQVF